MKIRIYINLNLRMKSNQIDELCIKLYILNDIY